jgi:Flp pilus assembly protein TadB
MIAFPWYLLAAGIVLVIVGFLLAAAAEPSSPRRRIIDPAMRDADIVRQLQRGQRVSVPSLIILAGFLCVLVSIVWRLVLMFV